MSNNDFFSEMTNPDLKKHFYILIENLNHFLFGRTVAKQIFLG